MHHQQGMFALWGSFVLAAPLSIRNLLQVIQLATWCSTRAVVPMSFALAPLHNLVSRQPGTVVGDMRLTRDVRSRACRSLAGLFVRIDTASATCGTLSVSFGALYLFRESWNRALPSCSVAAWCDA
jgi:hypothetical protein